MSDPTRPPGIPDEAWHRWITRSNPGTPTRPSSRALRVAVGDGDARVDRCDLCGGETAPFSWLSIDGAPPYALCATCRATLVRLHRLTGDTPFHLLI